MNVKNNRLGRETDERIIRAVYAMMTQEHRPIGKITVREICERTGVHRSTFYAHYQDYLTESKSNGVLQLAWETIRGRAELSGATAATFGAKNQDEMAYHGVFFLMGMTAMVRMWVQGGCREEPGQLYDLMLRQGAVQQQMIGW